MVSGSVEGGGAVQAAVLRLAAVARQTFIGNGV